MERDKAAVYMLIAKVFLSFSVLSIQFYSSCDLFIIYVKFTLQNKYLIYF